MTDLTKAAREALEALNAMLTHMGMDEDEWNKPTFNQARSALATLRAALSEAPGEERDERAAFEDWIAPTLRNGSHLNRSRVNQVYTDNMVAAKWAAWQARAMLAARPSAPTVALTEEQRAVLLFLDGWESLDGVWFGDPHPTQTGAFWWRRHLVRAFPWLTKGKEGGA